MKHYFQRIFEQLVAKLPLFSSIRQAKAVMKKIIHGHCSTRLSSALIIHMMTVFLNDTNQHWSILAETLESEFDEKSISRDQECREQAIAFTFVRIGAVTSQGSSKTKQIDRQKISNLRSEVDFWIKKRISFSLFQNQVCAHHFLDCLVSSFEC